MQNKFIHSLFNMSSYSFQLPNPNFTSHHFAFPEIVNRLISDYKDPSLPLLVLVPRVVPFEHFESCNLYFPLVELFLDCWIV